jgi:hypothetical protein
VVVLHWVEQDSNLFLKGMSLLCCRYTTNPEVLVRFWLLTRKTSDGRVEQTFYAMGFKVTAYVLPIILITSAREVKEAAEKSVNVYVKRE